MTRWQFITTTALGVLCLALSISVVDQLRRTRIYQARIQSYQAEIARTRDGNQFARGIIQDFLSAAPGNGNIRLFLNNRGIRVAPPAEPAPSAKTAADTSAKRPAKTGKGK